LPCAIGSWLVGTLAAGREHVRPSRSYRRVPNLWQRSVAISERHSTVRLCGRPALMAAALPPVPGFHGRKPGAGPDRTNTGCRAQVGALASCCWGPKTRLAMTNLGPVARCTRISLQKSPDLSAVLLKDSPLPLLGMVRYGGRDIDTCELLPKPSVVSDQGSQGRGNLNARYCRVRAKEYKVLLVPHGVGSP
jgi:hypothetical protein